MTLSAPLVRILFGLSTAAAAMLWNGQPPGGSYTTTAQARIGRPLTPMSYAGVARRTTRRAVTYGAAAGAAAAAGSYYYAPGCAQVVNAYGQIVYQCP
jgi:hypothetical protein